MKYHARPDGTSVAMGSVDDGSVKGDFIKPKEHIFLGEKARWWEISEHDGLERHEGFNEPFQKRLEEWETKGEPRRTGVGAAHRIVM